MKRRNTWYADVAAFLSVVAARIEEDEYIVSQVGYGTLTWGVGSSGQSAQTDIVRLQPDGSVRVVSEGAMSEDQYDYFWEYVTCVLPELAS